MAKRFHLYFDDSGSRRPDHKPNPTRSDGMDYFALGGIVVAEDDIDALITAHKAFMEKWELKYPLHSTKIRGARGPFSWLRSHPEKAERFLSDLQSYLLSQPVIGTACVIDRPGYMARYGEKYGGQPWLMCETAYAILLERTAKYVDGLGGQLEVFFEQAGQAEDTDIKNYTRLMKREGMPFDKGTSANYGGLTAEDFERIVLGEPRERTKKTPMMQVADLYLYPMVKGGYDPSYGPYRAMMEARRIIDAQLTTDKLGSLGVKYSCFDGKKQRPRLLGAFVCGLHIADPRAKPTRQLWGICYTSARAPHRIRETEIRFPDSMRRSQALVL